MSSDELIRQKEIKMAEKENRLSLIVFSNDMDKVLAAFILAVGATSAGMDVSMFFAFWGLNVLRKEKVGKVKKPFWDRMFGMMMPKGVNKVKLSKMNMCGVGTAMMKHVMKKKNISSLPELLSTAKDLGVKLVACQLSMDVMGITKEELIEGLEYGNVSTYLAYSSKAKINLFI